MEVIKNINLMERATILFPSNITSTEARLLLSQISKEHNLRIGYNFQGFGSISSPSDKERYSGWGIDETGDYEREDRISGLMSRTDPFLNTGFEILCGDNEELSFYTRLRFDISGLNGYDDLTQRNVAFWDEVREKLATYFPIQKQ